MMKNALLIEGTKKGEQMKKQHVHPSSHTKTKRRAFWENGKTRTILNNLEINITDEELWLLGDSWHFWPSKLLCVRGKLSLASSYRLWQTQTLSGLGPSGKGLVETEIYLEKRSVWHWCLDPTLYPRYSKCGSRSSSVGVIWKPVRKSVS